MSERAVWRLPWYVWCALPVGALALIHERRPWLLEGYSIFPVAVVLLALACGAALLWELPLATMACAAIALTLFSGSWANLGISGVPFDRFVLAGVILALVLHAPGASRVPQLRVTGIHLLLAFIVLYVAGSAAVAGTLAKERGSLTMLDDVGAVPFLMFLLAPAIFAGPRERAALLTTLVAIGGYLGLTATFEILGPHSLVFPHYIAVADATELNHQAGGPFRAPVTDGFACFACGVAAAMAARQWVGPRRWLAAAVIPLCALGTFLSLERGVWVAAGAGFAAAVLVVPELRRWSAPALIGCGLLIGGVLVASPALATQTEERTADELSVWDRVNQTATAFRMIEAKPVIGFGWDSYPSDSAEYFRQASDYPMTGVSTASNPLPLHDTYLAYAVELGLFGALLWVAALLWGLGGAILCRGAAELRPWKVGLLAISVFYCVLAAFNPIQQPFTALLLWVWAGLVHARASATQ